MRWGRALGLVLLCLMLALASTNCGKSDESAADSTPPSAPTSLTCTSPCNAATRTFVWDAATDDDSGVDHYLVTIDGGGAGNLWTILGNVTTYTFEAALAYPDGIHTFEVKAVDKAGNEGTSATLSFICDTTPPTISAVSASNSTETSCTITWTTNEDAVCQVEYGTTPAHGSAEPASIDFLSSYAYSYIINLAGLTAHTKYHYRVRATDMCGNEALSGDYTFAVDTVAPVISNVTVSGTTETGATITWTTDEPATSQVEYGKTANYGLSTVLDSSLVTTHTVNLTGLTAGTTYYYMVRSRDTTGNECTPPHGTFVTSP